MIVKGTFLFRLIGLLSLVETNLCLFIAQEEVLLIKERV